ncbi:EAL domain-containing protein [Phenylobacterium sp.]|uniref:EAL domain-containing protein n=1 Tax=Phenylobacterium sp. TaxID=1871053 RepID=UPI0035AE329A
MLVAAAGLAAGQLTVEVTESAAVACAQTAIATLERFRAAGLKVSADDYGAGQSTLSYLKSFPAQEIKIDQSFIANMTSDRVDQILVRSTIELAHALGLAVVAEGVEDQASLDMLPAFGCDTAQGWLIGPAGRSSTRAIDLTLRRPTIIAPRTMRVEEATWPISGATLGSKSSEPRRALGLKPISRLR